MAGGGSAVVLQPSFPNSVMKKPKKWARSFAPKHLPGNVESQNNSRKESTLRGERYNSEGKGKQRTNRRKRQPEKLTTELHKAQGELHKVKEN